MSKPTPVYYIDDHHGIHIPKIFAQSFDQNELKLTEVEEDDLQILKSGPDHLAYWDAWQNVEMNGIVVYPNGVKYKIHQDGDVWLIPVGMEWSEQKLEWMWPESPPDADFNARFETPENK